jgi:hypothetical protein
MFTTEGGGTQVASTPAGATAAKSVSNGLVFNFSFPNPGANPASAFDWSFTGPGSPAAQPNVFGGTVTFTGPGAVTITCLVNGATPPPANTSYVISGLAATAGTPRMVEGLSAGPESYDPGDHTVAEVQEHVNDLQTDEEIRAVYDAELAGKSRSTLLSYLESLLPYDPSEHTVDDVVAYAEGTPDEVPALIEAERAGKNRSTLLSRLEALQTT